MTTTKIDARRVSEILLGARPAENPVVSIYFSPETPLGTNAVALRDLVSEGLDQIKSEPSLDEAAREHARRALATASAAIERANVKSGTAVAFAWNGRSELVRLPVRIRSRIAVGFSPYVAPLAAVVENADRYALVLGDHRSGRIFSSFLGELEEIETIADPTEQNIARAGWFGRDQLKMNHHRDVVLHRHIQHVADRLFAHHRSAPFDRIVISAHPPATLSKLERALHPYLATRVVARETWAPRASWDELCAHMAGIVEKIEEEKERSLLSRVRDHVGGDLHAATGADATLSALWAGRVGTLVLPADAKIRGRACEQCRFLAAESGGARGDTYNCRECGGPTREVNDLVEEATEMALLGDSKVRFISRARPQLESLGGMAALLRYV